MKEKGMGRTRLGRFAAVTVPAGLATAGLGYAMLSGMMAAALSSANGFQLESASLTSSTLAVRPGATQVATGDGDDTAAGDETIFAETGGTTTANGISVRSSSVTVLPGIDVSLTVNSTDPNISLGSVILNAGSLAVDDGGTGSAANLSNVNLGVAQSESSNSAGWTAAGTGYNEGGFSLNADSSTLNNVTAGAYSVSLASLDLSDLAIGLQAGVFNAIP